MIGVLDSGVGGLSIYREIKRRYPKTAVIYFADRDNFPYGEKTESELLVVVRTAVRTLVDKGIKIVILACNSATVSTIKTLRTEFSEPIIGIEPATKKAAQISKSGNIGVLATKRTVSGHSTAFDTLRIDGSELVAKIESDFAALKDSDLIDAMKPFIAFGVDTVVLGCTHFSLVKDRLAGILPDIHFLEPTAAVVDQLERVLFANNFEMAPGSDMFIGIDETAARKI